jgi:hypothetical protein
MILEFDIADMKLPAAGAGIGRIVTRFLKSQAQLPLLHEMEERGGVRRRS